MRGSTDKLRSSVRLTRALLPLASAGLILAVSGGALADWPDGAERSGVFSQEPADAAFALDLSGAYVPKVGTAAGRTAVLEGGLTWNFGVARWLTLFGRHTLAGMWWGDSALRVFGHEVGARYSPVERFALEAAYLGHRVDKVWVDDLETHPGGIMDNGGEIGLWLRFSPMSRVRLDPHLLGRVFSLYNDTHWVPAAGLVLSLLIADGHSLTTGVHVLASIREDPRASVEKVTWNFVGEVKWRSLVVGSFGVQVAAKLSTSLLVGQVPMLELKRSMIDEPMGLATIGVFFEI